MCHFEKSKEKKIYIAVPLNFIPFFALELEFDYFDKKHVPYVFVFHPIAGKTVYI